MKGCEGQADMMEMMSKTMGSCEPEMMMGMMSHCLRMVLPRMSREEQTEFVLRMMSALTEQGTAGLSEQEKEQFLAKLVEKVRPGERSGSCETST